MAEGLPAGEPTQKAGAVECVYSPRIHEVMDGGDRKISETQGPASLRKAVVDDRRQFLKQGRRVRD